MNSVAARPEAPAASVIIPALNEEEALPHVLRALPREHVREVIVVDNGSTDRTADVARSSGARVERERRRGYGAACLKGISSLSETRIVVFLDGDYSDFPEDLPKLIDPILEDRADLVLGSRERGALLPQQWIGGRVAALLLGILFRARYADLGPFRAIRRDALERLKMSDRTYGWTVEMQVKASKLGLRVLEVPVRYRKRIGKSKISGTFSGVIGAGWKIFFTILKYA